MKKIALLLTAILLSSCIKKTSSESSVDRYEKRGTASATYDGVMNSVQKVTVEYGEQPEAIDWEWNFSW